MTPLGPTQNSIWKSDPKVISPAPRGMVWKVVRMACEVLGIFTVFAISGISGGFLAFYLPETLNRPLYDTMTGLEGGEGGVLKDLWKIFLLHHL
ncbi:hypothetical protein CDL15_Pgr002481 [Punica granatum]|uniref:Uncharacterized protein n=1 Tax=Punica granatum TaxID=22663 RepID=A0A218XUT7_PUNGR|nr:hypothetical protein CDL15_Pgr002481 [Punica granatum]